MIHHIIGNIIEKSAGHVVVETNGIGYILHISVNTFEQIKQHEKVKILTHQIVREDAHLLYGFASEEERHLFRLLISVSGVGANTARLILSAMVPSDLRTAILTENTNALKSIKGIGAKSASRLILELKDKMHVQSEEKYTLVPGADNTIMEEALSGLLTLGFDKTKSLKAIEKTLKTNPTQSLGKVIKESIKMLS